MKEYNAALEVFRKASATFSAAQDAYRARTIGDAEFLAARAEFKAADAVMDAAEAKVKGNRK